MFTGNSLVGCGTSQHDLHDGRSGWSGIEQPIDPSAVWHVTRFVGNSGDSSLNSNSGDSLLIAELSELSPDFLAGEVSIRAWERQSVNHVTG